MKVLKLEPTKSDPCMFVCRKRQVYVIAHVDDVHGTGPEKELKEVFAEMAKHIMIKMEPMLVPGGEGSFLRRTHAWGDEGLVTVPNKQLLEDLKEILNMSSCKPVGTPATKAWTYQAGDQEELSTADHSLYRTAVGKLLFVAQDRADIKYATKECARDLATPTGLSMRKVKRIVKYVEGTADYGTGFRKDSRAWDVIDVYCDSDWAACIKTRRSTSGIVLKVGGNTLGTWSKTQATVALSSGEAEFVALHQGLLEGLAMRSLMKELFGRDFKIILHTDSTAARAMAMRSGPGKVKHIDLKMMFIQELIAKKLVEVRKINTLVNCADLLTKAVDETTLTRLLWDVGVSKLDSHEVAVVTKHREKRITAHVRRHISAFVAAAVVQSATGYDVNEESDNAPWSWMTVVLGMLFYMSYFGSIIGTWECMKYLTSRLMLRIGLGPAGPTMTTRPITETRSTATDEAVPVLAEEVPVPVPAAAVTRAPAGTILLTFVGERYHTRRNCGHVVNRKTTSYPKCLDCARLDD
jgi:hypothetical protein